VGESALTGLLDPATSRPPAPSSQVPAAFPPRSTRRIPAPAASQPPAFIKATTTMANRRMLALLGALLFVIPGCKSPYYADQGAVMGGLGGAGLGALVGSASGNAGAGAAIGAAAGALTGAVVGDSLDDIEARNRAQIAAATARPVAVGAVTVQDVVAMTRSGVTEEVIAGQVRSRGLVQPLQSADIIYLQQQGVSQQVILAMQQSPGPMAAGPAPVMVAAPPPAVVVAEPYPVAYYAPYYPRRHCPPHGVSWGVSVSH
jgi:outer membrane lipoprotein SlyB